MSRRLPTMTIAAALVAISNAGALAREAETDELRIQRVSLEQALKAPAEALGQGYLWVNSQLAYAPLARLAASLQLMIDGREVTLTKDNVDEFVKAMEDRKSTYATAIRQRGFVQLGKTYDAAASPGGEKIDVGALPTLITQNGFELTVAQGRLKHAGVVVESAVTFEHAENPEVKFTGKLAGDKLRLTARLSGMAAELIREPCFLTLTENKSPDKSFAKAYVGRAIACFSERQFDKVQADLDRALQLDPDFPGAHNVLAQLLASCPDAAFRHGEKAVASARRACELTDWKDWQFLATLAAAYAEAADFTKAVEWAAKALEQAPEPAKEHLREQLTLYRSNKPFHMNLGPMP